MYLMEKNTAEFNISSPDFVSFDLLRDRSTYIARKSLFTNEAVISR